MEGSNISKSPALNALKHGAFSRIAILPGEDADEFRKLHASVVEEWDPQGPTEEDLVLTLAKHLWRKRRSQLFIAGKAAMLRRCRSDALTWTLGKLELDSDPDRVEEILRECPDDIREYVAKKYPRAKFNTQADWAAEVHKQLKLTIRSDLTPPEQEMVEVPPLGSLAMLMPRYPREISEEELLEKDETTEDRINAMIERTVKRLVQIKGMKQMIRSPFLEGKAQTQRVQLPKPA